MLISAFVSLINLIIKALGGIADITLSILPSSPFNYFSNIDIPYLDTLNWVLPIDFFIAILTYWVTSIALYYVVQVVLRWIKVVQ